MLHVIYEKHSEFHGRLPLVFATINEQVAHHLISHGVHCTVLIYKLSKTNSHFSAEESRYQFFLSPKCRNERTRWYNTACRCLICNYKYEKNYVKWKKGIGHSLLQCVLGVICLAFMVEIDSFGAPFRSTHSNVNNIQRVMSCSKKSPNISAPSVLHFNIIMVLY